MKQHRKWLIGLAGLGLGAMGVWWLVSQLEGDVLVKAFSSASAFKEYILSFGGWAPLIFFLIQVSQVIISPIPGQITLLAGGALFGAVPGFLLSGSGVLVGSLIAFYLARYFGQALVIRLVGQKVYERYNRFFSGKFVIGLFLMFAFPFFPDDALCFLAGLSGMRRTVFLLFVLLGRMPSILLTTLVGSGTISLSLWEWGIVGLVSVLVAAIYFRFGERFENWLAIRATPVG